MLTLTVPEGSEDAKKKIILKYTQNGYSVESSTDLSITFFKGSDKVWVTLEKSGEGTVIKTNDSSLKKVFPSDTTVVSYDDSKKSWYQVVILLFFIFIVIIIFSPHNTDESEKTASSNPSTDQKIYAPNEAFVIGDLTAVVKNVRKQATVGYGTTPRVGAKFIVFDVMVNNTGSKSANFYSGQMKALDDQGREFDVAGGNTDKSGRILDSTIEPGLSTEFIEFYVEVPQQVNNLKLKIVDNSLWASKTVFVKIAG